MRLLDNGRSVARHPSMRARHKHESTAARADVLKRNPAGVDFHRFVCTRLAMPFALALSNRLEQIIRWRPSEQIRRCSAARMIRLVAKRAHEKIVWLRAPRALQSRRDRRRIGSTASVGLGSKVRIIRVQPRFLTGRFGAQPGERKITELPDNITPHGLDLFAFCDVLQLNTRSQLLPSSVLLIGLSR